MNANPRKEPTGAPWIVAGGYYLMGTNPDGTLQQIATFSKDDDWEQEQAANVALILAAGNAQKQPLFGVAKLREIIDRLGAEVVNADDIAYLEGILVDVTQKAAEPQLRVWHIPQIPGKPMYVAVRDLREAQLLLDALAAYDQFQFQHRIKGDFANAQGLQVFEDGEWTDWHDPETGDDYGPWSRENGLAFFRAIADANNITF